MDKDMGLIRNVRRPRPVLERLNEILEAVMATQAEVDALTQTVNEIKTGLEEGKSKIEAEFAELEKKISEGGTVETADLTGLKAGIEGLKGVATQVDQLQASPPAAADAPPAGNTEAAPTKSDGTAVDA